MKRLEDKLALYGQSGITPMHMPGHKRNPDLVPDYLQKDITEIKDFDNLHNPTGIYKELEKDAASLWNAKSAVISVNGATAVILSAIMAASVNGKILIASNCHVSVWHALELTGSSFSVINPDTDPSLPFALSIDPEKVREKLQKDPSIKTVVITSPTYEGVVSDVDKIMEAVHEEGASLIVDSSHGSHFGIHDSFPKTPVADVVIKSIHKTLHAPTQTALLLTYSDAIKEDSIRHYMDIFESSSPSYILTAGISRVIYDLLEKPDITYAWTGALKKCRKKLNKELSHLKLYDDKNMDPSKLVIITGGVMDGKELEEALRSRKIEIEASFKTHIIAMTGIGDTEESLLYFADQLIDIDRGLSGTVSGTYENICPTSNINLLMSIKDAVNSESTRIPKDDCMGRISASYVFKYPPGIPVLIPGQCITGECLALVSDELLSVVSG